MRGAAGIGTIGLAPADIVDLSNLQRQIIHGNADVVPTCQQAGVLGVMGGVIGTIQAA